MKTIVMTLTLGMALLMTACTSMLAVDEEPSTSETETTILPVTTPGQPENGTSTPAKHVNKLPVTNNIEIETQIIRELRSAGCLIENFEMNRRKQNLRISCVKDQQGGDFEI